MEMKKIKLNQILDIENLEEYKCHFAKYYPGDHGEGASRPIDVFVRDGSLKSWQESPLKMDAFRRKYIISFITLSGKGKDFWLFDGIYKVKCRKKVKGRIEYEVELLDLYKEFIGRLIIEYKYNPQNVRVNFEKHYDEMIVSEILQDRYSGEDFPGILNIDHKFSKIKTIMKKHEETWKNALEHTLGIYLITDIKTGKRYVGEAKGKRGIWSRWKSYIETGHGGNVDLKKLILKKKNGIDYALNNFKFAILEYYKMGTSNETIEDRESYWKNVLMSRKEDFGHNKN